MGAKMTASRISVLVELDYSTMPSYLFIHIWHLDASPEVYWGRTPENSADCCGHVARTRKANI